MLAEEIPSDTLDVLPLAHALGVEILLKIMAEEAGDTEAVEATEELIVRYENTLRRMVKFNNNIRNADNEV